MADTCSAREPHTKNNKLKTQSSPAYESEHTHKRRTPTGGITASLANCEEQKFHKQYDSAPFNREPFG